MAMETQISSCMGSIDVGAGGTTTGSSVHDWVPSVIVTVTTSPTATPSVVSQPLDVVLDGCTSIGVEFTSTATLAPAGDAAAPSNITIRWGVIAEPMSG